MTGGTTVSHSPIFLLMKNYSLTYQRKSVFDIAG